MTYSITAFDPETGEHGVASQSNWFSVGSIVTFGEPGVGVVATQGNPHPANGPRGLDLMRAGRGSEEALAELVAADPLEHQRQVAAVDAAGRPAFHTGAECLPFCGAAAGEHHVAVANLMASDAVWGSMSAAYLDGGGPMAARLLDALDAGEAAGGDLRGRQSAAVLVVPPSGEAWERVVEVRVEDHPDPLRELRRLVAMRVAYEILRQADELVARGEMDAAAARYVDAWERAPEGVELRYWAGFALIHRGEEERGATLLREAIDAHDGWTKLLAMMTPGDIPGLERARVLLGN